MTKPVKRTQQGSVLCWEVYTPTVFTSQGQVAALPRKLTWAGYNSPSWWENVGYQQWYRIQKDDQGRAWTIDFEQNLVTLTP